MKWTAWNMSSFVGRLALLVILLFPASGAVAATPMAVTFLNPGAPGDAFFDMMTSFMQAAADDLGITLEVIYCDRDHLKMHAEGQRLLLRPRLPQYLIVINEKNAGADLLQLAAKKGVKVALINEGLQEKDRKRLGGPGETIANWVLELLPDDEQAGYMLARSLIASARARDPKHERQQIVIAGIAGAFQTGSSSLRVEGLRRAVRESRAILQQVVPAYWEEERAAWIAEGLLDRYPDTDVIWAASDIMARGVVNGVKKRLNGKVSIIIGGIDWAEFALHEVQNGNFAATVGGHFMDGGWAMVMLHDLHHGLVPTNRSHFTEFSLIDSRNIGDYLKYFGKHDWDIIDFTEFSRILNPQLKEYHFGLDAVMDQLHE